MALKSIVSLFFGLNRTLEIGSATFDAFITEEHSKSMKLTEFTVEDGSIINDHSIMLPRKLNIRAIRTNTPITFGGALGKAIKTGNIAKGIQGIVENGSAIEWVTLIEVLEEREPLSIVTVLEKYDNMVLTDISTMSDKDNSEALLVDMVFQEWRAVSVKEETISASKIANSNIKSKGTDNATLGQKPVEPAPQNISVLRRGSDGLGVTQ